MDERKISVIQKEQVNNKIRNLMLKAEFNKEKEQEYSAYAKRYAERIKSIMLEGNTTEYIVEAEHEKRLSALLSKRKNINYNLENIRQKLPKSKLKKVSDSFLIVDKEGMGEFLEKYPELRSELKMFISKTNVINEHKLALAINQGMITKAEIEGCFSVKETISLKIQRVNKRELI